MNFFLKAKLTFTVDDISVSDGMWFSHFSTCTSGSWQCTNKRCEATCSATGDPHYMTFDGIRYNFMGICSYTMVQDTQVRVLLYQNFVNIYAKYGIYETALFCYTNYTEILSLVVSSKCNVNNKNSNSWTDAYICTCIWFSFFIFVLTKFVYY